MIPENVPIVIDKPYDLVEIYPIHDIHYGDECFDALRWNDFCKIILEKENAFVIFCGDLMQNAVPNSKSDCLYQTATIREQQDFVTEVFTMFHDRTLAIVDGNHEYNRSTRMVGLYPLYSSACIARMEDLYRSAYAVVDFGFGTADRPSRAVGFVCHRARDMKNFASVDALEGFDFMFCGHDHEPRDHARGHLCYDRQRRELKVRSIEMLNSGSFLTYGGYGARAGYRPKSDKMYKLVLHADRNRQKTVETVGFYV